jgi:hypothetical protein
MSTNLFEGLIEKKEAAKEADLCDRALDNWAKRLGLRPIKHGRRTYYSIEEFKRKIRGEPEPRRRGRPAKV